MIMKAASNGIGNLKPNATIYQAAKDEIRCVRELTVPAKTKPSLAAPYPLVSSSLHECREYQTGVMSMSAWMSVSKWLSGAHPYSHTYTWTTDSSGHVVHLSNIVDKPSELSYELNDAVDTYCQDNGLYCSGRDYVNLDQWASWRPVADGGQEGIILYFDWHALGSYADGEHEVFVPLSLRQSGSPASQKSPRWAKWFPELVRWLVRIAELLQDWSIGQLRA